MTQSTELNDIRLPLTSADVLGERKERLKELFPEAFVEGQIDFDRLRNALGDLVGEGRERYGLSWAGKADAIRAIQAPSVGTLVPCPDESVNFDTTENLFIEGDNLEVLKLLQKSYYGQVKMIYIDPPYNTGNEFIYPDNFREGLEDYLKYSGQVGEGGIKLSTNTETSGRYHSKWLSMMYPRLFLARTLLREDGVIAISIGEEEIHNLRCLLSEVFGDENAAGTFIWEKKKKPSFLDANMGSVTEYIVCYAKHRPSSHPFTAGKVEDGKRYPFNNAGNPVRTLVFPAGFVTFICSDQVIPPQDMSEGNIVTELLDEVVIRQGKNVNEFRLKGEWRYSQQKLDEFVAAGDEVTISKVPFRPNLISRSEKEKKCKNLLSIASYGMETYEDATEEMRSVFGEDVMQYTKPTGLLRFLVEALSGPNDIVMDFFAGSGTVGHAVIDSNRTLGEGRRFILVQLPEPITHSTMRTIADIGKEKLRRIIKGVPGAAPQQKAINVSAEEEGFRVYKLTSSNFKIWDGTDEATPEKLQEQLRLFADHVQTERGEQSILSELMLKAGLLLALTAAVDEKSVAGKKVYSIADGLLAICLANPISQECLRGIIELGPQRIICLDSAFGGNDQLKTNTVLEMKSHGIEFRTV